MGIRFEAYYWSFLLSPFELSSSPSMPISIFFQICSAAAQVDVLLVPTVLQNFMVAEIEAEEKLGDRPTWTKNSLSGRFTNFVNLLDMAAVSVPSALLRSEDLTEEASRSGTLLWLPHLSYCSDIVSARGILLFVSFWMIWPE